MKKFILAIGLLMTLNMVFAQHAWDEVYYQPNTNKTIIIDSDDTYIIEDDETTIITGDANIIVVDDNYYAQPLVYRPNYYDNWFYDDWHYNRWCYNDYSLGWSVNYWNGGWYSDPYVYSNTYWSRPCYRNSWNNYHYGYGGYFYNPVFYNHHVYDNHHHSSGINVTSKTQYYGSRQGGVANNDKASNSSGKRTSRKYYAQHSSSDYMPHMPNTPKSTVSAQREDKSKRNVIKNSAVKDNKESKYSSLDGYKPSSKYESVRKSSNYAYKKSLRLSTKQPSSTSSRTEKYNTQQKRTVTKSAYSQPSRSSASKGSVSNRTSYKASTISRNSKPKISSSSSRPKVSAPKSSSRSKSRSTYKRPSTSSKPSMSRTSPSRSSRPAMKSSTSKRRG